MQVFKYLLSMFLFFFSFHAGATSEADIYNRVKNKSWSQLSSQERAYAQSNGLPNEQAYNSWKNKFESGSGSGSGSNVNPEEAPTLGINESALQGMEAQKAAAMKNMMTGAALMATGMAGCHGTTTWGCPLIPMAALAFMQGGHDADMAGLSDDSYQASQQNDTTDTDVGDGTSTQSTTPDSISQTVQDNLNKAASKGYKVDPVTGVVTNPDGSTTPASAFSSPAAMAAAGMSPEAIAAAQKVLDETGAGAGGMSASVGSMGVETGGAIGGSSGGSSGDSGGNSLANYFNAFKKSKAEKDRMIAGKSLTYGSDPIGVKADNIFMMVHRRYQSKDKVRAYFLKH
jgi:hypothetical protein